MIVALILIAFGFAVYADRIDDQRRCEDAVLAERAPQTPTRDDYRQRCPPRMRGSQTSATDDPGAITGVAAQ